ncbi:unnamed protein product [marine sediment metagenome]|uniref:Uncharacterized protein n=1 Tax=marine sediment metagenome TaxID=412755 RepID=X0XHU0_9ZZZZ
MANIIDEYPFIRFDGSPQPPVEQLDPPIQRRGVDGSGFWKIGKRGAPFQIRAWVDHETMTAAWAAIKAYRAMVGNDPYSFEMNDQKWDDDNWKVVVHRVEVADWHGLIGGTGGVNPPSGAMLVLDFLLCAVEVEPG